MRVVNNACIVLLVLLLVMTISYPSYASSSRKATSINEFYSFFQKNDGLSFTRYHPISIFCSADKQNIDKLIVKPLYIKINGIKIDSDVPVTVLRCNPNIGFVNFFKGLPFLLHPSQNTNLFYKLHQLVLEK